MFGFLKVFVTEPVKTGKPIVGWDNKAQKLVVTTNVTEVEKCDDGRTIATTEANARYQIVSGRER